MQIGSKELNFIRDLEDQIPKINRQIEYLLDSIDKIPIFEDSLSKVLNEIRSLNLTEIIQKLENLENNKLDKDYLKKILELEQ